MVFTSVTPLFSSVTHAEEVSEGLEHISELTVKDDELINPVNYYLDSKDFVVGEETGFYSWNLDGVIGIDESTEIVYQTEDGTLHTYTSEFSEELNCYEIHFTLDTVGKWKLLTINGKKVTDDLLDLMVYEDQLSHDAAVTEKLLVAVKEGIAQEERKQLEQQNQGLDKFSANSNIRPMSVSTSNKFYNYTGSDRYKTAVAVSQAHYAAGRARNVVIANGLKFPDALAAVSLAKQLYAPILFTNGTSLTSETRTEIKRLGASTAYIIGGTGVVSNAVESDARSITGNTKRIYGSNRQNTAIEIAKQTMRYASSNTAIIATGSDYPDAISISPYSGRQAAPILFAMNGEMDTVTKDFIQNNFSNVLIVGGSAAVSTNTETTLKNMGKTVSRIYGSNRYNTSEKIATTYFSNAQYAYFAVGTDFPDALSGGAMAAKNSAPMILGTGDSISSTTKSYLSRSPIHTAYAIGAGLNGNFHNSIKVALGIIEPVSSVRQRIVNLTKAQLGKPYKLGEDGPNIFDCSGLVRYVYLKEAGVLLPHRAIEQAGKGWEVSKSNLQPGDLLFFATGGGSTISHVGIYIGNGEMIHASSPSTGVKKDNIHSAYYVNTFITARSLLD